MENVMVAAMILVWMMPEKTKKRGQIYLTVVKTAEGYNQ